MSMVAVPLDTGGHIPAGCLSSPVDRDQEVPFYAASYGSPVRDMRAVQRHTEWNRYQVVLE